MNKIGILGGTFDPIHYGHLFIAENAMQELNLDKILFIPTGTPPHKKLSDITDKNHRYNMVKIAIEDNNKFDISRIEVDRLKISYTVDTINELSKIYQNTEFYYIVGADALYDMSGWKNSYELFKLFKIVLIDRITDNIINIDILIDKVKQKYGANVIKLNVPMLEMSSTEIRRRMQNNLSARYMLPDCVIKYIKSNNIYIGDESYK